jgi:hypothetical protein
LIIYYKNEHNKLYKRRNKMAKKSDLYDGANVIFKNGVRGQFIGGKFIYTHVFKYIQIDGGKEESRRQSNSFDIRHYDGDLNNNYNPDFSIIKIEIEEDKYSIRDLEEEIFRFEDIRIVIRGYVNCRVEKYLYKRKAFGNTTLKDWIETRVQPLIGDLKIEVINGRGHVMIHPRTKLESIRNSYKLD